MKMMNLLKMVPHAGLSLHREMKSKNDWRKKIEKNHLMHILHQNYEDQRIL